MYVYLRLTESAPYISVSLRRFSDRVKLYFDSRSFVSLRAKNIKFFETPFILAELTTDLILETCVLIPLDNIKSLKGD